MTFRTTARPTTGAGPHPQEATMNYRSIERILRAVQDGHIHRNQSLVYVDKRSSRDVDEVVYAAEGRGFLALHHNGSLTVTEAGEKWMGRDRLRARKSLTPTFEPPAVA